MEASDIDYEAQRLANSTITALIDLGYVLTLAESYGIKDRIVDLLEEEEELRPGRYRIVRGDA
jgi:hypothetical protein